MDEYGLQQGFPPVGDSYYWVGDEQINRKLEVLVGDIGLQNIKKVFQNMLPGKILERDMQRTCVYKED